MGPARVRGMTVALVMIVRDEAETLPRLLASVRDHIDRWTIVDTGSTDETVRVITRELDGIPGDLIVEPWVDFGTNRAQALELARGTADWLLLADADFEYAIEPGALDALTMDAHRVTILEGEMAYGYTGILRGDQSWEYEGVTHEALVVDGRSIGTAPGVVITHHCDGGARGDKFERDLTQLDGLTDPRSTYYRAQTLACLGRHEEAAATYLERAAMGGWDEEVYHSLYRAGVLLDDVPLLLAAYESRPARLEALYEAAHRLRSRGAHRTAFKLLIEVVPNLTPGHTCSDVLFVEPYVYRYAIVFEYALAAQNIGEHVIARRMYERLLTIDDLPDAYRDAIHQNMALSA